MAKHTHTLSKILSHLEIIKIRYELVLYFFNNTHFVINTHTETYNMPTDKKNIPKFLNIITQTTQLFSVFLVNTQTNKQKTICKDV